MHNDAPASMPGCELHAAVAAVVRDIFQPVDQVGDATQAGPEADDGGPSARACKVSILILSRFGRELQGNIREWTQWRNSQGGLSCFEIDARQGTIPARRAVHGSGSVGQGRERDGVAILRLLLLQRGGLEGLWLVLAGDLLLGDLLARGGGAVVGAFLLELGRRGAGNAHRLVLELGLRAGDWGDLVAAANRLVGLLVLLW